MKLLKDLAKELFVELNKSKDDIFNTDLIIVPSNKMEAYLKAYFLKNDNDGNVLMNINVKTLKQVLIDLYEYKYELLDDSYIKSLIIKYLSENEIPELKDYFSDSKTRGINIYDVSVKLTEAFKTYDDNLLDINKFGYQKSIYEYVENYLKSNNMVSLAMLNKENVDKKIDAYLFGFIKHTKLEESLIDKYINVIKKYDLVNDNHDVDINKITKIVKAPNTLREIEALHSDICNKLNQDKSLKFSDFLVLSTNLNDYSVDINRVFNQDNNGFPVIHFYIGSSSEVINETNNLLNLLFKIGKKNYFTRQDLSDILDNYITKKINNLDYEDVEIIKKSIVDLNVYRKKEDWEYFVKRLLVSKICDINDEDDNVLVDKDEFIPFTQIGLNNNNMNSIINIINNLYSFINIFENNIYNIDLIKKELEKWFSIKEYGVEKNSYYNKMSIMLDFWKNQKINTLLDTLFYNLIDLTNQSKSNKGSLYSSGVSFTSFDCDCVLEAKYIYFIGASSENLPKIKEKNPFYLSNIGIDYKDEENAFILYCNNSDNLYFSYVYKNLKENQEQYFLSTYVKKLYKNNKIDYYVIPLDETRDYEDITTKRGMDNKDYNEKLVNNIPPTKTPSTSPKPAPLDAISTGKIGEFLNEPLSFRANQLFGREDDLDEDLEEEFEPFTINSIDRAAIFKELLINELLSSTKDLKDKLKLENRLPHIPSDKSFTDHIPLKEYEKIEKDVEEYIKFIDEIRDGYDYEIICKTKYINVPKIIVLNDLKYPNFVLSNNYDVVRIKKDEEWVYIPLKVLTKIRGKDILSSYAIALRDVASLLDSSSSINVSIYQKNKKLLTYKYKMSLINNEASKILNNIVDAINNYSNDYSRFFDSTLLFDDEYDVVKDRIKDLVSKVSNENGGYWRYFDSKNLFDLFNQLGYGDDYPNEIEDMKSKMEDLIILTREEV